jgi:hypothetical protein
VKHAQDRRITIPCPYCGGTLRWRASRYGGFYGCSGYVTGCRATVGCHPDGSPLGTPADAELKAERIRVHEVFDRLWKVHTRRRQAARDRAYIALAKALWLKVEDCHVAMFDLALCARALDVLANDPELITLQTTGPPPAPSKTKAARTHRKVSRETPTRGTD